MSQRYKGGVISATPPTTSQTAATGVWTLQQQMQAVAAGNWPPNGPFWVEDVFSTYLYTGNSTSGGTQTITNNIDLSTKGGLVWIKGRSAASNHILTDTVRGAGTSDTNNQALSSNLTSAEDLGGSSYDYLSSFSTTGFVVTQGGTTTATRGTNYNNVTYASWTFRKQAKFFDVVTYTGDGASNRTIAHNLGSTPGCVIIKNTTSASDWPVYHRSLGFSTGGAPYNGLILNGTSATGTYDPPISAASSTTITVTTSGSNTNQNGQTFVAYLFAHDAGGFGDAGDQNVISCGSYTGDGGAGTTSINLGWEPQWILVKNSTGSADNWGLFDNMRGLCVDNNASNDARLIPNTTNSESNVGAFEPTATGFKTTLFTNYNASGTTYIYIAIRRGPMRTPTVGTSVFTPALASSSGTYTAVAGFPIDMFIEGKRAGTSDKFFNGARLIGNKYLQPNTTAAEVSTTVGYDNMTGLVLPGVTGNYSDYINWLFRRAPGFFDVVCYTGNDTNRTISHNLGVVPEMMIVKCRDSALDWAVYHSGVGNTKYLWLNSTAAEATASTYWNNTTPTSSVFTVGTSNKVNSSPSPYVAYLFASVTGVSKVGSYTGTGTTKQIDCGFTNGSRFVLIKRTDSTGDWYVWDSARGIVAGNDPYLLLNSAAAEVTNTDYVDTYSAGFELSSTAPAAVNANGGTFIFLAIA